MPSTAYFFSPTTDPSASVLGSFNRRNAAKSAPVVPIVPSAVSGGGASVGPFTLNPGTQSGVGPYGTVPGPIGKPPSLYEGAQTIYPGLANLTDTAGRNISHELAGDFSPETENALWDTANRFGVASGMPGAGLWSNRFMGNVAGAKEKLQQQGQQDYGAFLGNLAKTTDDPNLLAQIAARNATMAAAPNPAEAAAALAEAYRRAQLDAANRAFGPGGGTTNPYFGGLSPAGGTVPRSTNPFGTPTATTPTAGWHDPGLGGGGNISDEEWNQLAYGIYPDLGLGGGVGDGRIPPNTFFDKSVVNPTANYEPFGDPFGLYGGGPTSPQNYDPFGAFDQGGSLDNVATGNNYDPNADMTDEDWWAYLNGEG